MVGQRKDRLGSRARHVVCRQAGDGLHEACRRERRGVSVHRADCPNVANLQSDLDRIIEVEWAINTKSAFNASLQIEGDNRPGTLSQISQQISSLNVSIQSISGKPVADDRYIIEMTFEVANTEQLNVIIRNLKKLKCVSEVYRMNR